MPTFCRLAGSVHRPHLTAASRSTSILARSQSLGLDVTNVSANVLIALNFVVPVTPPSAVAAPGSALFGLGLPALADCRRG